MHYFSKARVGLAFKNRDKILDSVEAYNRRKDGKKDYSHLASELNK